jgi:hypothetical protein
VGAGVGVGESLNHSTSLPTATPNAESCRSEEHASGGLSDNDTEAARTRYDAYDDDINRRSHKHGSEVGASLEPHCHDRVVRFGGLQSKLNFGVRGVDD